MNRFFVASLALISLNTGAACEYLPGEEQNPDEIEENGIGPFFVAVGYGGRRTMSVDGATWDVDEADAESGGDDDNNLRGLCAGAGKVLAVGGSAAGRVLSTTDGRSWTDFRDDLGWFGGCAYGNDMFVAVGSSRSARSLDGGETWVDPTVQFQWGMRDIVFDEGLGLFVAIGELGVSTSPDGVEWTAPAGPTNLNRLATNGSGVLVATGEGVCGRSTNGSDWTIEQIPGVSEVHYANGNFMLGGDDLFFTSPDGLDWLEGPGPDIHVLAFGNGTLVSSVYPDVRRMSTDNGSTWTEISAAAGNAISDMIFVP